MFNLIIFCVTFLLTVGILTLYIRRDTSTGALLAIIITLLATLVMICADLSKEKDPEPEQCSPSVLVI